MFKLILFFSCAWFAATCGLEFHPRNSESSLIYYRSGIDEDTSHWTKKLDKFLTPYKKPRESDLFVDCQKGAPPEQGSGKVCDVKVINRGPCSSANAYSFRADRGGPCVFLTFSPEPNWKPQYFNSSTLLADMPAYLQNRILDIERHYGVDSNQLKVVWVSCDGEYPTDKENFGAISYYPDMGFGGQYFPAVNRENYLSPLVAVHFESLLRGIVIRVECKAWARNLYRDPDSLGYVGFDLLVDY